MFTGDSARPCEFVVQHEIGDPVAATGSESPEWHRDQAVLGHPCTNRTRFHATGLPHVEFAARCLLAHAHGY